MRRVVARKAVPRRVENIGRSERLQVKSFTGALQLKEARKQAAAYANQCGFKRVAMALLAPVDAAAVLDKLSAMEKIDDVRVQVTAIGWV